MKQLLVDTSVIIDFLRRPDKEQSTLFTLAAEKHHLHISIITYTELFAGKSVWEHATAREELQTIFSGFQIVPLESAISEKAGEIRARCSTDLFDAIVAASAIAHGFELVTLNTKHFANIPQLLLYPLVI